jgi:uncharacterized membrane protein (Fun14 family)
VVEVEGSMKIDGLPEISLGAIVGLALGYYLYKHWKTTGKLV